MKNNLNCKQNNYLYDPDIASIITIVLGTLGSIGGIIATIDYIEQKRDKSNEEFVNKERKKIVEAEIVYSFGNISFSANNIRRRLEFLEKICRKSPENDEKLSNREFIFGKTPILLDRFQFGIYQKEQKSIFYEIEKILENVPLIEILISENKNIFDNENYLRYKKLQANLQIIITKINNLMDDFRKIPISEFIDRTIQLCRLIEEIGGFK